MDCNCYFVSPSHLALSVFGGHALVARLPMTTAGAMKEVHWEAGYVKKKKTIEKEEDDTAMINISIYELNQFHDVLI